MPPGTKVGKYVVGELLGRGAMGVVYAAVDPALDRPVALKVMETRALGDERRARFVRETRSAAAASGPNIAAIYDSGEDGDVVYCAMELVVGQTLRAWMATRRSIDDVLRVARGVARGLSRAHAVGVVHRDLKPDNVMLDASGEPKVLDFGLAKRVELAGTGDDDPTELHTREGRLLGTPAYMSPEQAKGLQIDARSDVFSLGVMLYEMLAGQRPFAGKTTMELLIAIDRDVQVPPSAANPAIGPALDELVGRCLAKSADARPTSAELEAAIAAYDPRGDVARPRRRWRLAGVLAAGGVCAALAVWAWPRSHAPALTEVRAAQAAYDEGLAIVEQGGDALPSFERALELDPDLAAAHFHIARIQLFHANERSLTPRAAAREHLRKAIANEARLPPVLRALAHAFEPMWLRDRPDLDLAVARLDDAARAFPDDELVARVRVFVIAMRHPRDHIAELEQLQRRFPTAGNVATYSQFLAGAGRLPEARAIADDCIARWPTARPCLHTRLLIARADGDCAQMEALARQFTIAAPDASDGYVWLAQSLAGRAPTAAVRAALDARTRLVPSEQKAATREVDATDLAVLDGDVESALAHARRVLAEVAASRWEKTHAVAALRVIALLRELGRDGDALDIAKQLAAQRAGWERSHELDPDMLAIVRLADPAAWSLPRSEAGDPTADWFSLVAYPAYVEGSADAARAAVADPRAAASWDYSDRVLGTLYLRAGDASKAVPLLEHAAAQCWLLDAPVEATDGLDDLGRAREQTGDRQGACAVYEQVSRRWPTPGTRAGDHARSRVAALTCTK